jgi:uncharacterized protein YbbC (DUF1343 family)
VPQIERSQPDSPLRGVLPGIDVLSANNFDILRGKRIGLVTNQTGRARDGQSTIDVLFAARRLPGGPKLVALFGPEHGLRGTVGAGASVSNGRDMQTGLPVYSLYGSSKRPSAAASRGIDVWVFDMQEIGSRSYTYISTLGEVMAHAAKTRKPLVVLDRPNPIRGDRIEGSTVSAGFKSFVSPFPIPYCHGLTMGELAQLVNARKYLPSGVPCQLRVVPMLGYSRAMTWPATGLPWVKTSPNIPRQDSPYFYAATGIVGELSALSIGIGTPFPFQLAGAPGLDAARLESVLKARRLAGFDFRAARWTPRSGVHAGRECSGVQIFVTDTGRAELTRLNFELMDAARRIGGARFASSRWFAGREQSRMFDLVCGSDRFRRLFLGGASADTLWRQWNSGAAAFRASRARYLLY